MEKNVNPHDATTTTPRDLPEWIRLEDMGPYLRRVHLAGRILTLGEIQQLPRSEDLPYTAWETVLGTLAPRPYRENPDDPARMPLHEVLVVTDGGLQVYVILDETPDGYGVTAEGVRRPIQEVLDAPRILLAEWTAPAEAQA
jgi:hypothetical protein